MTTITSLREIPDARRLHVATRIAMNNQLPTEQETRMAKENMARRLAYKILESKDFFNTEIEDLAAYGVKTMSIHANCIVLTDVEFTKILQDKFKQGVQHAAGFQPQHLMDTEL